MKVKKRLGDLGVVSILVIDNVDEALHVGEALMKGGLPSMEITFRTEAAANGIRKLVNSFPDALVGAGTILTSDNLLRAQDSGAQFVVTPGLNPLVVEKAIEIGMPICPGVMTPSDVERGLSYGLDVLKFFPAGQAGGAPMMKALAGPYAHTGVQFIPTGGVNSDNLGDYLSLPTVIACGGTWIASKDRVKNGDWDGIEETAKQTV
ncbi:MAG: bifunctional 4-hydroxy-2-oxoglutarate aldolase/2-dehydro-3-deoxy-phosphogluconate aldolase, partial [Candidatus Omnitrophica bacterium]|nr:bifunctional 4-hydroxy-2-oxoglutarate aldolase/2-dehydro-3-deoxy-phosphogluconate aldolase [Candidatus Omnitrophota bacterium]